jgi:hypothetical protein
MKFFFITFMIILIMLTFIGCVQSNTDDNDQATIVHGTAALSEDDVFNVLKGEDQTSDPLWGEIGQIVYTKRGGSTFGIEFENGHYMDITATPNIIPDTIPDAGNNFLESLDSNVDNRYALMWTQSSNNYFAAFEIISHVSGNLGIEYWGQPDVPGNFVID